MSGKKGTTRKVKSSPTTTTSDEESTTTQQATQTASQTTTQLSSETTPAVTDWTQESKLVSVDDATSSATSSAQPQKKSVLDFDRTTVQGYEARSVSDLSNDELLMVLIRRGEAQKNPVISGGCERLLRQINRERITPHRVARSGPQDPPSHYRGRPQGSRRSFTYQIDMDDEDHQQANSPSQQRSGRPFRGPSHRGPSGPGGHSSRGPRFNTRGGPSSSMNSSQ